MILNICFKKKGSHQECKQNWLSKIELSCAEFIFVVEKEYERWESQMWRSVHKRYSELDFGQISKQTFTESPMSELSRASLPTKFKLNLQ